FAHFRKEFWAGVATGRDGYLDLLLQLQSIRNFQANLTSQEQNLRLHEELFRGGKVSVVQVDQAFQSYQQGLVSIAQAEAAFQTSLDSFKITLGLPPRFPIVLDDSLLAQFQLTERTSDRLRDEVDNFQRARFRELDALPPLSELRTDYGQLRQLVRRAEGLLDSVANDVRAWGTLLGRPPEPGMQPDQQERSRAAFSE